LTAYSVLGAHKGVMCDFYQVCEQEKNVVAAKVRNYTAFCIKYMYKMECILSNFNLSFIHFVTTNYE